jgi:hypothetical protein
MQPLGTVALPPPPPQIKLRAERITHHAGREVRVWIDHQAREEVRSPVFNEALLRGAVLRRFQGQIADSKGRQADAVVFLVLKAAAYAMEEELREAMGAVKDAADEKAAAVAALDEFVESRSLLKTPPPERGHLRVVPPVSGQRLEELDDAMVSAERRVQRLMERRTRFISTLFNMLSRVSATPDTVVRTLR